MEKSEILKTPTFFFTSLGIAGLVLDRLGWKHGDALAFIGFVLASGGVAMALSGEVEAKKEPWRWDGIYRSVRRPRPTFKRSVLTHLPQLVAALALALAWKYRPASGRTASGASRTASRR